MASVNLLAVLVSAIASMALGAFWYSPSVFGRVWMRLSGVKPSGKGMAKPYFVNFVAALVTAYVLAMFVWYTGVTAFTDGIIVGIWAWLGFVATVTIGQVLWEGRSVELYLLNNAYSLLSLMMMGAILAGWQ